MCLDDGAEVRRTRTPDAIVASTSPIVASGSAPGAESPIVAPESVAAGEKSAWVTSPSGETGASPLELSPANGVPTPGEPGFRAPGFLSDRNSESSMARFQNGANSDCRKPFEWTRESLCRFVQEVYTLAVLRQIPRGSTLIQRSRRPRPNISRRFLLAYPVSHGFRTTAPFFITKSIFRNDSMSSSGLAGIAMISAYMPTAIAPRDF
jgi:hypothetical protein